MENTNNDNTVTIDMRETETGTYIPEEPKEQPTQNEQPPADPGIKEKGKEFLRKIKKNRKKIALGIVGLAVTAYVGPKVISALKAASNPVPTPHELEGQKILAVLQNVPDDLKDVQPTLGEAAAAVEQVSEAQEAIQAVSDVAAVAGAAVETATEI